MRIRLQPIQNGTFAHKIEFVKHIKYCTGLGLKESKDLMDLVCAGQVVDMDILEESNWADFRDFMQLQGIRWALTEGNDPIPAIPNGKKLRLRLLRDSDGQLYGIVRLIEGIKFLRDGTEPKIGLKEAKDMLDSIREGNTIDYTLGNTAIWEEFRDFFKEEHVEIREIGGSSTEPITFVVRSFQGNFSTELDLRNYLADTLDWSVYEVMTKLDGLRFGQTFEITVAADRAEAMRQELNRFEVEFVQKMTAKQPAAVSEPQRDEIHTTNYHSVRCRFMASDAVENKLLAIKRLKEYANWGLKESMTVIESVSIYDPEEVTLPAHGFEAFKRDMATHNIQIVVLEWIR